MIEKEFLENVEWFIEYKPSINSITLRDTKKEITIADYNKIVINFEHKITLKFPLNNDYSSFDELLIDGKQTLSSLFQIIYKFYRRKLKKTKIDEVFKNFPELYEELMDDDDVEYIRNIDGILGGCCPPDFVGLGADKEDDKDTNTWIVHLGPL